jgi:tetratricopeptide (TPR) repeat protein
MRIKLLLIYLVVSVCVFAYDDEDFFQYISNKDYGNAINIGQELVEDNNLFYILVSTAYHNVFDYESYSIYRSAFHESNIKKLDNYLEIKREEFNDNSNILTFLGIVQFFVPSLEFANAKELFEKSLELDPTNEFAANYLSFIYSNQKDFPKTEYYAKQAIRNNNRFPEPYVNLSYVYSLQGEEEKAKKILLECIENCPKVPLNLYQSVVNVFSEEVGETVNVNGNIMLLSGPAITDKKNREILFSTLEQNPQHIFGLMDIYAESGMGTMISIFFKEFKNINQSYENEVNYFNCVLAKLNNDNETLIKLSREIIDDSDWSDYYNLFDLAYSNLEYGNIDIAKALYMKIVEILHPLDNSKMEWIMNIIKEIDS